MLQTSLVMPVAEVITELLDAPTMSRILKLAMAKYKGRLQINASGLETGKSFYF
jgi:hypothetical protein